MCVCNQLKTLNKQNNSYYSHGYTDAIITFTVQTATSYSATHLSVNIGEGYQLGKNLFYEIMDISLCGYNGNSISFSCNYSGGYMTIYCSSGGQVTGFNAKIYKADI